MNYSNAPNCTFQKYEVHFVYVARGEAGEKIPATFEKYEVHFFQLGLR